MDIIDSVLEIVEGFEDLPEAIALDGLTFIPWAMVWNALLRRVDGTGSEGNLYKPQLTAIKNFLRRDPRFKLRKVDGKVYIAVDYLRRGPGIILGRIVED